ncbi:hypothetical protein B0H13DRAFT_2464859 [Mycena leptocephala]|nr:hypothetical protein B0H13DRAFT_2464859 [Mycena leptocephala]
MGIVPETQVAVQQGVQTRDLMSFLAAIQTWSERHKQTVYALKRDQMKGFDYLAPEGFYDAVRAYGLPQSIIDLDRAAQEDAKCRIRTYYGPTSPIVVSGVTKQGGPASPLKAIYRPASDVDSLVITTSNALRADPHRRDDTLQSLRASQKFCLHMERFQRALSELKDIIDAFTFPRLTGRLPITLLRKMVAQNIADAEALDVCISTKIHGILGMPFSPSSKILTLPVSLHGLGFPSIARINAGIAGFTHDYKKIPAAWITAQAVMSSMDGRMTDQHDLLIGAVSISHVVALCNHHNPGRADNPDGNTLRTMRAKNIRTLADLGYWRNGDTDGSMIPASASLCESRRVTAAVTGPTTLVVQLNGLNLSILHGELMGHILALVLRSNADPTVIPTLYSDHQNSVDLIEDIQTRLSLPSQLNREADHYASGSQRFPELVPIAPTPTFTMDAYTLYTKADGWVESNARNFIDFFLAKEAAEKLAHGNKLRMLTSIHDNMPPPDYPYTRALSAHSAVIQLYARSGQLPTAEVLESRSKLPSCMCRLGCDAVESVHHIFVDCAEFAGRRILPGTDPTHW